jgi:3-oxoacyl-[acyl-carrier-protein] synthase III
MKIIGTGSALPTLEVSNDDLAKIVETNDEWIVARTGIKTRRILSNETLREIATLAAKRALENAGIKPTELDYILCSSTASEYITPGLSSLVHSDIDANCPCLTLNAACTGFIYALQVAQSFIESGVAETIMVLCAEEPTRIVDWNDRSTCVLFGDGAGAVIVQKGGKKAHIVTRNVSLCDVLYYRKDLEPTPFEKRDKEGCPLVMKGQEVFKNAVTSAVKDISYTLEKAGIEKEDVAFYMLHQANMRIIESISKMSRLDSSKFPHDIEKRGNTSSASIPILLDELNREGKIHKGDKIVFNAFGAGFTSGVCLIEW